MREEHLAALCLQPREPCVCVRGPARFANHAGVPRRRAKPGLGNPAAVSQSQGPPVGALAFLRRWMDLRSLLRGYLDALASSPGGELPPERARAERGGEGRGLVVCVGDTESLEKTKGAWAWEAPPSLRPPRGGEGRRASRLPGQPLLRGIRTNSSGGLRLGSGRRAATGGPVRARRSGSSRE